MNKVAMITACLALLPMSTMLAGCKEDTPPKPLTDEPTAPTPEAEPVLLAPEPVVDAGEDAAKKATGTGRPASSLAACCSALNQNAANAPEPTATYMRTAAQTCTAMVGQGQAQNVISAAIRAALQGANMPSACR